MDHKTTMKTSSDLRLYILMRNDLQSMVPGRCMAQASHASNALVHKHGSHVAVKEWQRQTQQGFGTTIVLAASMEQIDVVWKKLVDKKALLCGKVVDPDYVIRVTLEVATLMSQNYDAAHCTYKFDYMDSDDRTVAVSRSEETCLYVLGTKDDLSPILGDLSLY
jgi:peptidyl-tRNA hydrolase